MKIRYDFSGGEDGWTGTPFPALASICAKNSFWQSSALCGQVGYWEHIEPPCELGTPTRYVNEVMIWLAAPGLDYDRVLVGVQADHLYVTGADDLICRVISSPDLISWSEEARYDFSASGDDEDFGCQEIELLPAAVVSDNYIALQLVVYGSTNIGVDPEPEARITYAQLENTTDELRFIGMAADSERIYVTANQGGMLKCWTYGRQSLGVEAAVEFGAVTYAELDARTHGAFPVVKPANDGHVFVRGRDGNDNQVQKSENSGAAFSDVSDGGWGSTKYAVALLPDPLKPDDLVVIFSDDDLYQSKDGADNWSKLGDAPVTLREAARHLVEARDLMLAEDAADSLRFTNNLGGSFDDISDSVGTVNAIEVSR